MQSQGILHCHGAEAIRSRRKDFLKGNIDLLIPVRNVHFSSKLSILKEFLTWREHYSRSRHRRLCLIERLSGVLAFEFRAIRRTRLLHRQAPFNGDADRLRPSLDDLLRY